MNNEQIEFEKELTRTWIGTDFGAWGIVGWNDFDNETTLAVMEAMLGEKLEGGL